MRYARPMIAAVLFDLDETLLDRRVSLTGFLAGQHDRFAGWLGGVPPEIWRTRFLALDDRGRVHKSVVCSAPLAEFGGDPGLADTLLADYRERCCRHATAPRNCLFVGDDPAADILGADRAGMRTAWLRGGARWPERLGSMPGVAIEALPGVLELLGARP